jgi:hypothetical protein
MLEKKKTRLRDLRSGPSSGGDDEPSAVGGMVTVTHGSFAEDLPVAQMSVRQVRQRFHDRLDIHPQALAVIGGVPVDDDTIIGERQALTFIRPSGEKGAGPLFAWATGASTTPPDEEVVVFSGDEVHARLPEGTTGCMPLSDLMTKLLPGGPDTGGLILPDGVKRVLPTPDGLMLVHQTPPLLYSFKWISDDSEAPFGPGTEYRSVRIALPYVVTMAVFEGGARGIPLLSHRNECFFSNQPLESEGPETPLHYPALLNCSRYPKPEGYPLSWICTQHLSKREFAGRKTLHASVHAGLKALLHHLLESGFNRSSEMHEGSSWFKETVDAAVDPRIASIETWQEASAQDPLFVLDVPWLATGKTLQEVCERIIRLAGPSRSAPGTASDIARLVINGKKPRRRTARA